MSYLNPHIVGIVMKEAVRRAIGVIRAERTTFESKIKMGYGGTMNDVVTSADIAAQAVYIQILQECFPEVGIIAEEDELSIIGTSTCQNMYFTVDPLDGTRAFARKQSDGVGTMIALVYEGSVIGACIGNVFTQELFYFRPESSHVHRIFDSDKSERLVVSDKKVQDTVLLLQTMPKNYTKGGRVYIEGNMFKDCVVIGGSIGVTFTRLWTGEVGGIVLRGTLQTPWDCAPVFGISQKMGFQTFEIQEDGTLTPYTFNSVIQIQKQVRDILIINPSCLELK